MKNNFDILKDFFDFSDPGKFYLALVVQRKKDNGELGFGYEKKRMKMDEFENCTDYTFKKLFSI